MGVVPGGTSLLPSTGHEAGPTGLFETFLKWYALDDI
jgi:hypothetical protein